jgi:hypothetical protein
MSLGLRLHDRKMRWCVHPRRVGVRRQRASHLRLGWTVVQSSVSFPMQRNDEDMRGRVRTRYDAMQRGDAASLQPGGELGRRPGLPIRMCDGTMRRQLCPRLDAMFGDHAADL